MRFSLNLFKKKKRIRTVSSIFQIYSMVIVMIAIVLLGAIFVYFQFNSFYKDAEKIRTNYFESQKSLAKNETQKVIDYINYTRLFIEDKMKNDLKERCSQGWLIMENIYRSNRASSSNERIKAMVKDALRPIRFNGSRGYYFIVSMNGKEELYPVAPQLEGRNLINLQDDKGNFVIRDELNVVKTSGEGFVTDYWRKPGIDSTKLFPKISYVKYFAPLNLYIGCGEYLDNVEEDIQRETLQKIREIRFGENGYVFVNTYDGKALIIDSEKYKAGDDISDMTDPTGVKVFQEEFKTAVRLEGGFINYQWKKLNSNELVPKVAYVQSLPAWRWIIGAGVYTDEIDQQTESERGVLLQNVRKQVVVSLFILLGFFFIIFFISRSLSIKIGSNFELFIEKISHAVTRGADINKDDFSINDLQQLAQNVNEIIKKKIISEEALKENEIRFRAIFENVPVMIAIIGKDRKFQLWNTQINNVFNLDFQNQVDKEGIKRILTKSAVNKHFDEIFKVADGKFWELEFNTQQGIKSHNWAFIKAETGDSILVGYDITELRESQQKLRELNAEKDKFLSIIAHDLRSPFSGFLGLTRLMAEESSDMTIHDFQRIARSLQESANNLYGFLENLLEWSRLQRGITAFNPQNFAFREKVEASLVPIIESANNKNIDFKIDIPSDLGLTADSNMIESILRNLSYNAVKFTPKGGKIEISARMDSGGTVKVAVKDSGIGMNNSIINKLFKIDEQTNRDGTEGEPSTGLGLIICKDFIEKHGGRIWAESQEGKGSQFYFTIPFVGFITKTN